MILYQMIHLSKELEDSKEEMHTLAAEKGYADPDVVKISEKVDQLVARYRSYISVLPINPNYLIKNQENSQGFF